MNIKGLEEIFVAYSKYSGSSFLIWCWTLVFSSLSSSSSSSKSSLIGIFNGISFLTKDEDPMFGTPGKKNCILYIFWHSCKCQNMNFLTWFTFGWHQNITGFNFHHNIICSSTLTWNVKKSIISVQKSCLFLSPKIAFFIDLNFFFGAKMDFLPFMK